jgi:hypothetical protein
MIKKTALISLTKYLVLSVFALSTTLVSLKAAGAEDEYEEVTYTSLLSELSKKKNRLNPGPDPFENVTIHAHFGMVNNVSTIDLPQGSDFKFQSGVQIGFGIDLFSPNWYAEGAFKNYGTTKKLTESFSLREFDLKFGYRNHPGNSVWGYRIGTGITSRYFRYQDSMTNFKTYDTTPASILMIGLDTQFIKNFALGIEVSGRNSLVANTIDKNSIDMALRMDSYF